MASSFTLTKDGFEFKNANNETKSITIDDATNRVNFQQFSVTTPFVENREYVGSIVDAISLSGGDTATSPDSGDTISLSGGPTISSPDSWIVGSDENHGFFALSSANTYRFTRPGDSNHEHFVSLYGNGIKWITGADKDRLSGVVSDTLISWSDQTTWTRHVSGD
jgi:hypothetical protein